MRDRGADAQALIRQRDVLQILRARDVDHQLRDHGGRFEFDQQIRAARKHPGARAILGQQRHGMLRIPGSNVFECPHVLPS